MGDRHHGKNERERERQRQGNKGNYLDGAGSVPPARNHAGHSPSNKRKSQ